MANGDGKLTAADADFAKFKVMVSNADGSMTAQTLAALGITEINLTGDAITNSYDDTGDGVTDRIQTITKVTNGDGSKTETLTNKIGNSLATAVTVNQTVARVAFQ